MPNFSMDFPVLGLRETHDGDTWRLDLDVGYEHSAWPWLRLKDYSCPELDDKDGVAAKAFAEDLLEDAVKSHGLWVRTFKRIGYEDMKKSFARYLAEVYIGKYESRESDPPNLLGEVMVKAGVARHGSFMH